MNRRSSVATLLFLVCVIRAPSANADDARAIEVAKKSYEQGQQQYNNNDIEGARLSFAQSFAAYPAVETLRALAIAELDTGRYVDALKHFKAYTRDKNADPEFLKKVPALIDTCNQHVAHIRVVAPTGATILVDGHRVMDPREPLDVTPGTHTIALRNPDPPETRTATVGATQTFEARFVREPAPTSARPVAEDPATKSDPHASRESFWTTRHVAMVGFGAAAVAAAAVGTGFGIAAISKHSSYDDLKGGRNDFCATSSAAACDELLSTASAQRADAHVSTVAFVAAGVLAAGVGVAWLWPGQDERRSGRMWLAPTVGQGTGGMVAGGHF